MVMVSEQASETYGRSYKGVHVVIGLFRCWLGTTKKALTRHRFLVWEQDLSYHYTPIRLDDHNTLWPTRLIDYLLGILPDRTTNRNYIKVPFWSGDYHPKFHFSWSYKKFHATIVTFINLICLCWAHVYHLPRAERGRRITSRPPSAWGRNVFLPCHRGGKNTFFFSVECLSRTYTCNSTI